LDTVSYATATAGVTVSLATGTAQNTGGAGSDTISNFENLTGSAFNDTLTGDSGNNTLSGGTGNDVMNGGTGTADVVTYSDATSGVTVNLTTLTGQNTGGAGTDTITNVEGIIGSGFADTLTGDTAANVFDAGAGADLLLSGVGADTVTGGAGADAIAGGADGDTLTGGTENDQLWGEAGTDTLIGSEGDDNLYGGAGNDALQGGAGSDTYYFGRGDGTDTITDDGTGADDYLALFWGWNGETNGVTPTDISFTDLGAGSWRITITATGDNVTFNVSDIQYVDVWDDTDAWFYQWNGSTWGSAQDY